jgi:CHAD domain-containing protein
MRVATENGTTRLYLGGAEAQVAEERADLWRRAIGPLSVLPLEGDAEPLAPVVPKVPPPALPIPDNLRGDEPTSEGARRVLRRFFERLLAREEDVRAGEDPEDVHQMRVATRRLRASLQVAEPVYDAELVRRYRRGLRSVARALGAVRDRDVFLQSLRAYQDGLPEAERAMLNRLIGAVEAERAEARVLLVADLEERRYERFKREFATFLTTPLAGLAPLPETGAPPRVRDVAGSGIWRRYEELRAFEAVLEGAPDETLHAARIAGKRLRYALEFFQDALGPGADDALAPLAALQETLGALQDAVVARQHIADLHLECDPGAISYLAALDATHTRNMADLPAVWGVITGAKYRRRLLDLMAWV